MVAMETRQIFDLSDVKAFRFQCAKDSCRAEVVLEDISRTPDQCPICGQQWKVGVTWDGTQLVITGDTNDLLLTLPRNADGTYTAANAASQGEFTAALDSPQSIDW